MLLDGTDEMELQVRDQICIFERPLAIFLVFVEQSRMYNFNCLHLGSEVEEIPGKRLEAMPRYPNKHTYRLEKFSRNDSLFLHSEIVLLLRTFGVLIDCLWVLKEVRNSKAQL